MGNWKKGEPHRTNKNPNMLEGIASIAEFIGRSYNTTYKWIMEHGLPATKTPEGIWLSHKGLILQWMYAGHQSELKAKAAYSLEPDQIEEMCERWGIDAKEVFALRDKIDAQETAS